MALCKKMRIGWFRCVGCAVVVGCCAAASVGFAAAGAGTKTKAAARRVELSPWELAERGRETLDAIPEASRTKADYAAALDGFRAVYHESPQDVHAPTAVYAVAELLAEQGRGLHDAKSLKAAVGQYEFLRTQYPGSSLRIPALLAEGQIYANDLGDKAAAKERYALLLKQYPKSGSAEEVRAGLEALEQGPGSRVQGPENKVAAKGNEESSGIRGGKTATTVDSKKASGASSLGAMPVTGASVATHGGSERMGTSKPEDEVVEAAGETGPVSTTNSITNSGVSAVPVAGASNAGHVVARRSGKLAQVTGIRHWSTPTYTRVAIDLGDDVTFEAARVPNPDRIYFDLHGTQLARELVGKSFGVTDDGFLKKIRAAQFSNDMTRVVLDVNDVTEYSAFLLPNPYRLIIDIHGGTKEQQGAFAAGAAAAAATTSTPSAEAQVQTPTQAAAVPAPRAAVVTKPTQGRPVPNTVATRNASTANELASLSEQPGRVDATTVPTSQPIAAVVKDLGVSSGAVSDSVVVGAGKKAKRGKGAVDTAAVPARAAVPTADGQTSLVRALGLKIGRIVIDAGHGGHDSGTLGVDGIEEKDVVLDVALRLGKALHDRLGAEIIYTRSDDTFIPLETRTAIANKAQADLFLSIHANSSSDSSARGVETYYLNFTSSPDALETAARENAVSDQSIHQLSDLVKKIALKDKISESREFASDVEASLYGGLQKGNVGLKDRGVKKAPFVVLIGANMPSILAEISFVTNPKDANQLQQPEYRQRVAESLYKGVAKYAGGLSGVKTPTERASAK